MGGYVFDCQTLHEWSKYVGRHKAVIDFHAQWCGPCKQIAHHFKQLASEHRDVHFVKVDIENEAMSDVVREFDVRALPTFIVMDRGKVRERIVGANLEKLKDVLVDL